jgi:hypothetical protein
MTKPLISALSLIGDETPQRVSLIIDSFRKQTYKNKELILINNAENSYKATRIPHLQDPRIKLIDLSVRYTAGIAKNHGLSFAQGDIIALYGQDHYHTRDRLLMQSRVIKSGIKGSFINSCYQLSEYSDFSIKANSKGILLESIMFDRIDGIPFGLDDKAEDLCCLSSLIAQGYQFCSLNEPDLMIKLVGNIRRITTAPITDSVRRSIQRSFS